MRTNFREILLLKGLILLSLPLATSAETFAIIGTGEVGAALGPRFASLGHEIIYGSRSPDREDVQALVAETGEGASATTPFEAAQAADVIVLGLPDDVAEDVVIGLGDLSGKIIIDPTNPMERSLMTFKHGVETSNAQLIQDQSPNAKVVKAFNTLSWETMVDPETAGGPVSIPLAGDDGGAKKVVAELVEGMGLEPVDVGGVENAHWVEGMLILWINNRYGANPRPAFDYHLRRQ